MEKTPAQVAGVARLKAWALSPEGRARIGLNGPHPFAACRAFYSEGRMAAKYINGWCSDLVTEATGRRPGRHRDKD